MHSLLRLLDVSEDIFRRKDGHRVGIEHPIIAYLQVLGLSFMLIGEQIIQTLHVNLKVIHLDLETGALLVDLLVHVREEVENSSGYDSVHLLDLLSDIMLATFDGLDDLLGAEHAERLAGATLAVRENSSVEAFRKLLHGFASCVRVHQVLGAGHEDLVEGESRSVSFGVGGRRHFIA